MMPPGLKSQSKFKMHDHRIATIRQMSSFDRGKLPNIESLKGELPRIAKRVWH
jgi:hypothetical protein